MKIPKYLNFKRNLLILLMLGFILPNIVGCSLLKIASQPFKNKVSKVPQSTEKSERKITCKGVIWLDSMGKVIKCEEKFYSHEKNYTQLERKLKWREKISQFILNVKGYILWFIVGAVVLSLSGFGWIVGGVFSVLRGTGRVARDLIRGIQNGKKHIRQNGSKYTEKEREIYQKGVQDLMDKIGDSVKTVESKKIIGNIKAKLKED